MRSRTRAAQSGRSAATSYRLRSEMAKRQIVFASAKGGVGKSYGTRMLLETARRAQGVGLGSRRSDREPRVALEKRCILPDRRLKMTSSSPRRSVTSHLAVEQTFGPKIYTRRSEVTDLVERRGGLDAHVNRPNVETAEVLCRRGSRSDE